MRASRFRAGIFSFALTVCVGLGCGTEGGARDAESDALLRQAGPVLPPPAIARVTLSGSGCPGRELVSISDARDTFEVSFGRFEVEVTSAEAEASKDCTLTILLEGPEGVSYAPAGASAVLWSDAGGGRSGRATFSTLSRWSGGSGSVSERFVPSQRGRTVERVADHEALWSPCTGARALQLVTSLRLTGSDARSMLDEISGLSFRARRCEGGRPDRTDVDAGVRPAPDGGDAGPAGHGTAPMARATVSDVQLVGGGCAGAGNAISIAPDQTSFDVRFEGFRLPGASLSLNCQIWFDLTPPAGYRATVGSFVIEGAARIPADGSARLETNYWLSGRPLTLHGRPFDFGAREGAFTAIADFTDAGLVYGECRTVPVTISLSAYLRAGASELASFDIERVRSLRFEVEMCP